MKIAVVAPIIERVPPKKYGGTERVIYTLTEELVKRGHDVSLFASGDTRTSAKLISVYPKALREADVSEVYGPNPWTMLNIGLAYKFQDNFDVIHEHNNQIAAPTANISNTPVVMTLHGALSQETVQLYESLNNINYVSISNSQAKPGKNINWVGNVYNGLYMNHYPFSKNHDGYLLFVGRISQEKGVHNAIEVAKRLDLPLIIAAKLELNAPQDIKYFHEKIEPNLSNKIRWIGEVDEEERNKLMSKAMCFIHALTWPEPFGLTLIESMACGCPVIAFNLGSIPEVIEDKKTGYVVNTLDQMIEAVKRIDKIDRSYCRNYSLSKFNAENMARGYEDIYRKLISNKKPQSSVLEKSIRDMLLEPIFTKPAQRSVVYADDLRSILSKNKKNKA